MIRKELKLLKLVRELKKGTFPEFTGRIGFVHPDLCSCYQIDHKVGRCEVIDCIDGYLYAELKPVDVTADDIVEIIRRMKNTAATPTDMMKLIEDLYDKKISLYDVDRLIRPYVIKKIIQRRKPNNPYNVHIPRNCLVDACYQPHSMTVRG